MIDGEVDFRVGDIVRVRGWSFQMEVVGCNYYTERLGWYVHEGIENPVCCAWGDADGAHEEWFSPNSVVLVQRPATQI